MKKRRNFLMIAAVGIAAVAGVVTPAQAASYDGNCNYDEACLWQDFQGGGSHYDTLYSKTDYSTMTYYGTSVAVDNTASSARNEDPNNALRFYQYANWTGDYYSLGPQLGINFSSVGFDNKASSHCWYGATVGC